MNLFKKIFTKNKVSQSPDKETSSKYMPKELMPVDEEFMVKFTEKNGKLLYCDNMEEAYEAFQNILIENNWKNPNVCCNQDSVKSLFTAFPLNYTNKPTADFYLSDCEYLISSVGGVLVCSHQLKDRKLQEIPDDLVILSYTSQLTRDISQGLQGIKNKTGSIPTNITTIQHFGTSNSDASFMSYGSSTKNLYLLLVEDL